MNKNHADNLDTSVGNTDGLPLRRNPFIVLFIVRHRNIKNVKRKMYGSEKIN